MKVSLTIILLTIVFNLASTCGNISYSQRQTNGIETEPTPPASSQDVAFDNQITPGRGTTEFHLGLSQAFFVSMLSEPNENYSYREPYLPHGCNVYAESHWIGSQVNSSPSAGDGLFVYFREERAFEIGFSSERFKVDETIGFDSSLADLEKRFVGKLYTLTSTASKLNGYRDLKYLVVQKKGISFELYYDARRNGWFVWKIYVFQPNIDFVPEGCLDSRRRMVLD